MAATITNGDVDTRISALAPGIVITRVTDLTTVPIAQSDVPIEFDVTSTGTHFWATYEQLGYAAVVQRLIDEAEGVEKAVQDLKAELLDIANTTIGSTYTQATYNAAIDALQRIRESRAFE